MCSILKSCDNFFPVWLSTGGLPLVLRVVRPASREQLSKSFSVNMVQDGVSGFVCRRLGITWCIEILGEKKPPDFSGGLEG